MTTYRPPGFPRADWEATVAKSALSTSRKQALLVIGSYVGWAEGEANHGLTWVSQGAVSQRAGLDRKTVNRAVQDAKEKGLLVDLGCSQCGNEGLCHARKHTRVLGVSLPELYVPGNVPRYVPRNVPGTRSSNASNTTDGQVVEGSPEHWAASPQHSTGSNNENLTDVEDVDGLVGRVDDRCPEEGDRFEPPPDLRAEWTREECWCAFKGCPVATPDGSRFCADHADDVGGSKRSSLASPPPSASAPPPSKVVEDHQRVDGPEETPSSARTRGRPGPDPSVDGLRNPARTRKSRDLPEVVWTCDNCGYGSMLIPKNGCPQCDNGKLTKKQVAARMAEKPRPWKLKTCMLDGCNNERASGADLCGFHYYEKLNLQCAWPLGRPGGIERCTNTGRPFEPLQREDGWAPKLCDDHVAMFLDGSVPPADEAPSSVIARTEVPGAEQPDEWPEEMSS